MTLDVIKWNYEQGLWSKAAVLLAARKGIITKKDADKIIAGKDVEV